MKVKSKLYINMAVTLVGIATIGGFSLVGVTAVQRNLSLLTERSTPYQLKTIDLQRTLQEHTSSLLKIGSSTASQELKNNEEAAQKTLAEVHRVSAELAAIKGGAGEAEKTTELEGITQDMTAITRERLQAEESALAASRAMSEKLLASARKLKEMDGSIKKVQSNAVGQLSSSNEGVRQIASRLKDVQRLKDLLKDLKLSVIEVAAATNKTELTIALSHYNATIRWIANHDLIKNNSIDAAKNVTDTIPDITKRVTGPGGLAELKTREFGQEEGRLKVATQLKDVQRVKELLKDLKLAVVEVAAATNKTELTVAQSHYNTTVRWITNHDLIKSNRSDVSKVVSETIPDITKRVTGAGGLLELRTREFTQPDEATRRNFQETQRTALQKVSDLSVAMEDQVEKAAENVAADNVKAEAGRKSFQEGQKTALQKISDLSVAMEDQVEKAFETASTENKKFDESFKGSKSAVDILAMTGEIVALGSNIAEQISLVFGVRNTKDLETLDTEIQAKFAALEATEKKVAGLLAAAGRKTEGQVISGVQTSHAEIKDLLWGKDGLIGKIRSKIGVIERAVTLNERLKEYVAKQRETGKLGVSAAQDEQEKTVSLVNRIVRTNITSTAVLGTLIFVLGIVFSKMLERSITKPILELGDLAERFAEGDFRERMDDSSKDEFGELAGHFNHASEQLGEMTAQVSESSSSLAASAEELSAASTEVNRGAGRIAEMTQKIASSTSQANELMTEAVQVIENSNTSMNTLTEAMKEIAVTSSEAHSIINTINAVAFQTKLLSLNAAVEAARAGEAGAGFAVVAEEVKKLAARADEASRNTAKLIEEIVQKINRGQLLVGETNAAFGAVTTISKKESTIIDEITEFSNEQAMEIEHVYNAIMEMEKVAQQNSTEAQKLAATADMFKTA